MIFPTEPYLEKLYDTAVRNDPKAWGGFNAHDPSIFKEGDTYYVFSTDTAIERVSAGVQIRKSIDLINWTFVGQVLDGVPAAAYEWTGARGLWAPDLIKVGDTYYLYYCASQFGKNRSFIGFATSKSITGPWEDQGEVLKTDHGDPVNAIDPNVQFDTAGNLWMCYGSFWSGISVLQLDKATGKPLQSGFGKLIAGRHRSVEGAIEGPYIIYHPLFRKYYLFVSYDSLFKDYNVRVGRSDRIDGPYVDSNGVELTETAGAPWAVGNKILGGYKFGKTPGWIAPGHNSILNDNGNYYIVHHARGDEDPHWHYLHVRKMLWTNDGWPLISPERYAGETEQSVVPEVLPGNWEVLFLLKANNQQLVSYPLRFLRDGVIDDGTGISRWRFTAKNNLILTFYDQKTKLSTIYESRILPSWDWENYRPTLVFTGIGPRGVAIWGKKAD